MYGSALGAELGDVGHKARHERHVARESVQLGDHHRLTVGFRHQALEPPRASVVVFWNDCGMQERGGLTT